MNIQFDQLTSITVYIVLFLLVFKGNKYVASISGILIFILFTLNPFRTDMPTGKSLEKPSTKFNSIPEKVIVTQDDYESSQEAELKKLKQQSGDLKDEIHN